MELMVVYLCGALAAGITSYLWYFRPAILMAIENQVDNEFTQSPKLSGLVFILLTTLIAPLILFVLFMPNASDKFQDKLTNLIQD